METALSIAAGLGLAAACGFRVFAPMLVVSVAGRAGYLELGSGFDWIGTMPALIALGVATLAEVLAYYVPWLDNLLDTVATPAAVVAGAVLAASVVTGLVALVVIAVALLLIARRRDQATIRSA